MSQNFIESRREQGFLLPPDVRDWLPEDHLAWFVIDAVADMDLAAFYGAYRADGHGRAAYEPSVIVTLILYAYATKVRSSRAIECHCRQDVAYRVITGNLVPDHATIARFVARHEQALADLFSEVLRLCDEAGLVKPGLVAIDGTRLAGDASKEANSDFDQIAKEMVAEHRRPTRPRMSGSVRRVAMSCPSSCAPRRGGGRSSARQDRSSATARAAKCWVRPSRRRRPSRSTGSTRSGSWRGLRVGKGGCVKPSASSSSTAGRTRSGSRARGLSGCCRRPSAWKPILARSAPGTRRLSTIACTGGTRRAAGLLARRPRISRRRCRTGKVNLTDPDSRYIKAHVDFVQGYNAQAVVDEGQIVLAAEITNSTVDWSQLDPMVTATITELERAGVSDQIETALADTQYWNEQHMDEVIANKYIQVLIPPDGGASGKQRKGWTGGCYTWMRYVLASELGERLYRKRKQMIEPVFGHTRHNRQVTRFHRRGRTAVRTEWRLLMATHNLTKLHRHQIATQGA
jgi:transposase